jgi:signal transduction histidine kinase
VMAAAAQPFELAFASLPEPTLLFDRAGRLGGANPAAEALLGRDGPLVVGRGEGVGGALGWLAPALARVLAGADEAGVEAEVATPEGARWLGARLRRMGGADAPCGAVVVLEDLTTRRAVDAQLRSAECLAALGTLAAGLAHEVNNPLACVVSGLSFVEGEHDRLAASLAPAELCEAREALEEAREAARRVSRIVRSLQCFGTPAAPLRAEVDLAAALRHALCLAGPALGDRVRFEAELAAGVTVRASESLLVELFLALLEHAVEVLPASPAAAQVLRLTLSQGKGVARVAVSDAGGSGASSAGSPEPTADAAPIRVAGLGLSISHGIVTALGGTLAVTGTPGCGVVAVVTLPACEPASSSGR